MPDPLPTWSDSPSTSSPLDAANLNEYTTAVGDNQTAITSLQSSVSTLTSAVTTLQSATNVTSVTAGDSSVTVAGTATAPTVKVAQANLTLTQSQVTGLSSALNPGYSAGGQWAPNVYGTLFENMEREDAASSGGVITTTNKTLLILLGLVPAGTYSTFKIYVSAASSGTGVTTCALYSSSSLTSTSWSRLGAGNVALGATTAGLQSTALAFTLSSPAYVALQMVATTAYSTTYPTFLASATSISSTFSNPVSGCPVLGTATGSTAPGTTLNPTTGFTSGTQKIWCALA